MNILSEFQSASGLALNMRKSCLFLDENNQNSRRDSAGRFGLLQGSLPVMYLGLPLMPHKLRPQDYQPLIDKVLSRIASWIVKHLSFAVRLQLIQSVLFSIVNFWSSIFPLPKSCLERLESICNAFLWSGAPNSSRGAKISWISVCSPKKKGGLGLRNLMDSNQVYGLKLIWLLFFSNGSLWVAWIRKVILQGRLFWNTNFQHTGSWIWKLLMKLRPLAQPYLLCQVSSGALALFWHDDWTCLCPLIDITGNFVPRVTGLLFMALVKDCCNDGDWLVSGRRHPILIVLRECLSAQSSQFNPLVPDKFFWRNSFSEPPNVFSTSKTWISLHPPLQLHRLNSA